MASRNKRRPKTAEGQRDKGDAVTNESGEEKSKLALDTFFQKYVAKWFQQGKVDSVLYYSCRQEIEKLKGKVEELKNLKQEKSENLDADELLPNVDNTKQKAGPRKRHQQAVNADSKVKSPPVSVPQEQHVMIAKEYQKARDKIHVLQEYINKLINENDSLSRTVENLQRDLKRSYAQTNDIQTRYSKLASETLKNNNPNIADLSDPYRPTEITKHFSELYNNEWSDAYEALTTMLKCSEEESLQILFDTVESSFEFMQEQREHQVQLIRQAVLYPVSFVLTKEDIKMEEDLNKFVSNENMEIQMKEIRKTHAPTTAKILAKVFRDIEFGRLFAPHEKITNSVPEALKKYAHQCAQLSWHMVVADPPIAMAKSVAGKPFDLESYRPYTKSIKSQEKVIVEADVWPALYLHFGGPLLDKGVAQPGRDLRK